MKRAVVSITALCALFFGLWAVSAASNFAGTWELDKSKSQLSQQMAANVQSQTLVVTQDANTLTVDTKTTRVEGATGPGGGPGGGGGGRGGGMGGPRSYKLDGSESSQDVGGGQMTGKLTTKTKWLDGGKSLEISAVTAFGDRTNTTIEHWELAEGGKVLKIHRKSESQRGTQESTLVYVKK
ncbi:MAG TPA: hypothetical protein VFV34_10640 [Blastocatellia bacterium]|nr:hypothetical protein [Blastocatellia bacterium]